MPPASRPNAPPNTPQRKPPRFSPARDNGCKRKLRRCHPERAGVPARLLQRGMASRRIWVFRAFPSPAKVIPFRVHGFDESNLFGSPPSLNLLLAGNRVFDSEESLVINQPVHVVFGGESLEEFFIGANLDPSTRVSHAEEIAWEPSLATFSDQHPGRVAGVADWPKV